MKDYVAENERILDEWKQEYQKNGLDTKYYFARDGIMFKGNLKKDDSNLDWIHEPSGKENEMWKNAPLRVLYLTKDQNSDYCGAWDVRTESYHWRDQKTAEEYVLSGTIFHQRLVWSLHGLLTTTQKNYTKFNDFTNEQSLQFVDEHIFARINCKKSSGGRCCNENTLRNEIEKYSAYLKAQILNLDADVFVGCGARQNTNAEINDDYYNIFIIEVLNNLCGYHFERVPNTEVYYDSLANKVAINSYHLSCRMKGFSHEKSYIDIVEQYYRFLQTTEGKRFVEQLHK